MARRKPQAKPARSSIALRWLAVAALVLVGLLYYRPLHTYVDRRDAVADRGAVVDSLRAQRDELQRRYRYARSEAAVRREARRLGYVKPGERLFIVKGIPAWRSSIAGDGR